MKQNSISKQKLIEENTSKKLEDDYELKEILGQGCFGSVYKAVHKASGKLRAIKQIDLYEADPQHAESLETELKAMTLLDHPNVIKIFEFYWTKDKKQVSVVMEILEGGELEDHLKRCSKNNIKLNQKWVASVIRQVL